MVCNCTMAPWGCGACLQGKSVLITLGSSNTTDFNVYAYHVYDAPAPEWLGDEWLDSQ